MVWRFGKWMWALGRGLDQLVVEFREMGFGSRVCGLEGEGFEAESKTKPNERRGV